jgi:predicted acylesterase/phospholipase RssA
MSLPPSSPAHAHGRRRRGRRAGEPHLPGFREALTRSLLLGSVGPAEAARPQVGLVIAPPNEYVGMLEWHQLDGMRESGREAARRALERAPEQLFA